MQPHGIDFEAALKSLSVLYVEDDHDILESMQRPLGRRVRELFTAVNGEEGLIAFDQHNPDIVITDIRMPVMDGLKMAREIRRKNPQVPVIITSAFDETEYFVEAIDIGVSQYVLKPIDINKLLRALDHCVRDLVLERTVMQKNSELKANLKILTEYKNAVDVSAIVSKAGPDGLITEVNDEFCRVTGFAREELIGKPYESIHHPEMSRGVIEEISRAIHDKRVFKGIVKNRRKNKDSFYASLTVVPILNEQSEVIEYIDFRQDITQLINQIYTDPLTNFPNRAALARDVESSVSPLMAVINIDSFKEINDFYGNEVGDFLLKKVVKVLHAYLSTQPYEARVYKLSSDEFGVLLPDVGLIPAAQEFVQMIHAYLESHTFRFDEYEIFLSVSSGFTTSKEEALVKADMALKVAKRTRKDVVCFEDLGDVKKDYEHNITWTKKLKKAIEEDRIRPWFQPIIDNKSGEIVKYECLMRMFDEDGTVIAPGEFLDVAYKTRLYYKLARTMIAKSCEYFRDKPWEFSFNMTVSEVMNREIVQFLKTCLTENRVADRVVVELLESEGIEKYPEVEEFIRDIKALGCKVAIDDFGSGYSNFEHLLKLKVDFIKIDGSIIRRIDTDRNSLVIAETIADFARKLGIRTVAEFVHSGEILTLVNGAGIDYAQGYHLGKPAPEVVAG
ncbi:MAG: EAL domain-containing protein [Campylobacterales bacterium]